VLLRKGYSYIRGHCGWDTVTLLYGAEVGEGEEHRVAHTLFKSPEVVGSEIGFLYPPVGKEDIYLRIIDSTTRTWLPMCGGMSQVIGLATATTSLGKYFRLNRGKDSCLIRVQTDSDVIPIELSFSGNRVSEIRTHMTNYAQFLYEKGVQRVMVNGIPAMKVGYFLIFNMEDLRKTYPNIEFGHRRPGPHMNLLGEIQQEYLNRNNSKESTLYSMIYDLCPKKDVDAKIFTRFFRGRMKAPPTQMEAQCGTGTIAVGIAMAENGELPFKGDKGTIHFEWGNHQLTRDPYGIKKSVLDIKIKGDCILQASFAHNVVEILSEGTLYLPFFKRTLF